jgi:hypothetical protein
MTMDVNKSVVFVCLYIYIVCVCMYVYICVCMCVCMYMYICVCMCVYMYIYTYTIWYVFLYIAYPIFHECCHTSWLICSFDPSQGILRRRRWRVTRSNQAPTTERNPQAATLTAAQVNSSYIEPHPTINHDACVHCWVTCPTCVLCSMCFQSTQLHGSGPDSACALSGTRPVCNKVTLVSTLKNMAV